MRRPAYSWRYLLPATGAPIGDGLMKIGHAGTWAAASVALAPFAILITVYAFLRNRIRAQHLPQRHRIRCHFRRQVAADAVDRP